MVMFLPVYHCLQAVSITTVENQEIEITTQNSSNNILLDHLAATLFRPMLPVEVLLLLSVCRMVTNMPR